MEHSKNTSKNASRNEIKGLSTVAVLTKYAPLVKSRAISFCVPGLELDDLIQEGNIGLLSATQSYDGRTSVFATFARKCIDSAIIDYLRRQRKVSTIPGELIVDIDGIEVEDLKSNLEHSVSSKDEYQQLLVKAEKTLSHLEHSVFLLMLRGFNTSEIAEVKGVDIKSARNAVQRIRAKLK